MNCLVTDKNSRETSGYIQIAWITGLFTSVLASGTAMLVCVLFDYYRLFATENQGRIVAIFFVIQLVLSSLSLFFSIPCAFGCKLMVNHFTAKDAPEKKAC